MHVKKVYATVSISAEALYSNRGIWDARYVRRSVRTEEPPTPEVWERYHSAKAGLEALGAYEFTEWGGPDYGTEVPEPEPTATYEYLETIDEWLARCSKLAGEESI